MQHSQSVHLLHWKYLVHGYFGIPPSAMYRLCTVIPENISVLYGMHWFNLPSLFFLLVLLVPIPHLLLGMLVCIGLHSLQYHEVLLSLWYLTPQTLEINTLGHGVDDVDPKLVRALWALACWKTLSPKQYQVHQVIDLIQKPYCYLLIYTSPSLPCLYQGLECLFLLTMPMSMLNTAPFNRLVCCWLLCMSIVSMHGMAGLTTWGFAVGLGGLWGPCLIWWAVWGLLLVQTSCSPSPEDCSWCYRLSAFSFSHTFLWKLMLPLGHAY